MCRPHGHEPTAGLYLPSIVRPAAGESREPSSSFMRSTSTKKELFSFDSCFWENAFGETLASFQLRDEQGVWELCLSARNAPGGALTLAPAVTFQAFPG